MYPKLVIDIKSIESNVRTLSGICRRRSLEIIGITKGCLGMPEVGMAMIRGGVTALGDSRIENLKRLRDGGLECDLIMLRNPMTEEIAATVTLADITLVSDTRTILLLSKEAVRQKRPHGTILMIETGDMREGVASEQAYSIIKAIRDLPGLRFLGVGTNVACLNKKRDPAFNIAILDHLVNELTLHRSERFKVVSGGNSGLIRSILAEQIPDSINQVRFGEAILLGRETLFGQAIDGLCQDVFLIEAEVIQVSKTSKGTRAVAAIGTQDIDPDELEPIDAEVRIVGATSDHLVFESKEHDLDTGHLICFRPGYHSLLRAMMSVSVVKSIA